MDVGVGPVRVGHHEESVLPLGPAHRQLIADVQRLLRVQLPRGERLADLIAQHVGVPLLLPARDCFVAGLAQKKFAVSGEGVALIGADQGPVQGLFRVLAVVEAVRQRGQDRLIPADMVGYKTGRRRWISSCHNRSKYKIIIVFFEYYDRISATPAERSNSISMERFKISFSDVDWGEDEAKNDESLERYFVEFPEYEKVLDGKKRYIIGRKGTGKSAILQKLRLQAKKDPTAFFTDISLRDFPLNDFKALGDRSLQDKSKYVSAWKFLILTELVNLIVQDNSVENSIELELLKKFVNDNFPDGISIAETISKLRQNENKISIVLSILSGEYSSLTGTETTAQIHFNKAVKTLENLFTHIASDSTYFLLIDELDEGFQSKNSNLSLVILSLLRATDEIFNFLKKYEIHCIPVLVLRSDIFDNLEDNDLNKIDDYVLRLNWTTDESDPWSLKQIAEKRIAATLKLQFPNFVTSDYWGLIADNNSVPKGLWQYICVLTFSRPRDIIKLLKYCSSSIQSSKLTLSDVQKVEITYSNWFYREFRDEIQSFLPCWKEALNCISEVAKGKEKTEELINRFKTNGAIMAWCKDNNKMPIDVLKVLFNYSVVGCINDSGRWIFKYKDDYFEFMPSYPYYCVHYGFCRKLRIPKSYDKTILSVYWRYN